MALPIRPEERGKWIAGAVLGALALLLFYRAFFITPSRPAPRVAARPAAVAALDSGAPTARPRPVAGRRSFDPGAPPAFANPKLRLDLLAKVAAVTYQGTERNIFQYQAAPPPAVKTAAGATSGPRPEGPALPPPPPPPPPIPLKYYGYAHKPSETAKRAFFVDGEEIYIAAEGEVINKRYKIIKIGVNTVEVEDLVSKHRQTLPLQES